MTLFIHSSSPRPQSPRRGLKTRSRSSYRRSRVHVHRRGGALGGAGAHHEQSRAPRRELAEAVGPRYQPRRKPRGRRAALVSSFAVGLGAREGVEPQRQRALVTVGEALGGRADGAGEGAVDVERRDEVLQRAERVSRKGTPSPPAASGAAACGARGGVNSTSSAEPASRRSTMACGVARGPI